MEGLYLKIKNGCGEVIAAAAGTEYVNLVYKNEYLEGDAIVFGTDRIDTFYVIQLDDALGSNFVYITKNELNLKCLLVTERRDTRLRHLAEISICLQCDRQQLMKSGHIRIFHIMFMTGMAIQGVFHMLRLMLRHVMSLHFLQDVLLTV